MVRLNLETGAHTTTAAASFGIRNFRRTTFILRASTACALQRWPSNGQRRRGNIMDVFGRRAEPCFCFLEPCEASMHAPAGFARVRSGLDGSQTRALCLAGAGGRPVVCVCVCVCCYVRRDGLLAHVLPCARPYEDESSHKSDAWVAALPRTSWGLRVGWRWLRPSTRRRRPP